MLGKQALKHIAKAIKELDVAAFSTTNKEDEAKLRECRQTLFEMVNSAGYELTFPHYGLKKVKQ